MPHLISPPRPGVTIPPDMLHEYEDKGWGAQPKYDGDRMVVAIERGRAYLSNRHRKWHPNSKFEQLRQELSALKLPSGLHYLDGELLPGDILALFDVLHYKDYLIGINQMDRLAILADVCGAPTKLCEGGIAYEVTPHIWMATWTESQFRQLFDNLIWHKLVEGVVLRRKDSALDSWGSSEYEVPWQVRCRRGTKNYRY